MSENEAKARAEKIVDEKIGFYHHLYSYIVVNVILAVINILFSPDHWWFIWVSFFWGISLFTRSLVVYLGFLFLGNRFSYPFCQNPYFCREI